jgi:hypothetical protein
MMPADLYADWLGMPAGKRPPTHFQLLGLSVDETNPAVIEQAAKEQAQRIREHVDPSTAEAAKALMQEITRARAVLLDPAKRTAYRASLQPAGAGAADPWWKQEVMPSANKSAPPAPKPRPAPVRPASGPSPAEFEEIDDGIRRRRKKSGPPVALLVIGGGGVLLAVAAAVAAIVILSAPTNKTEQTKHPPTTEQTQPITNVAPTHVEPQPGPTVNPNPPIKSSFLANAEAGADAAPMPTAPKAFKRHTGLVQSVSLSPRQHRLLSAGGGGVIEWDVGSDRSFLRHEFRNTPALGAVYLSEGKALAADEGSVLLIDLPTNEVKATLKNPRGNLQCLAADPDGKHCLTGGSDGSILWWDIAAGTPALTIPLGDSVTVASVAMSPDRKFIAAGASDGSVSLWEVDGGMNVWKTTHHKGGVAAVAFNADGSRLASAGLDGVVALWNPTSDKPVNLPGKHTDGALSVAFMRKGAGLISGGGDKTLKFWNYDSGHLLRSVPTPDAVHAIAVPTHDAYVLFAGKGGMVQLLPMPLVDVEVIAKEEPPEKKLATPNAAELDEARMALREKYKAELAAAKPTAG